MVGFINKLGGVMYVDDSRVDEYKAAGYMPVANIIDTEEHPQEITSKRKRKKVED